MKNAKEGNEKVKQYVIMPAYTDNYHVIAADNGKVVSDDILAYYELDGYVHALESQGYEKAYFLPEAKREFEEAEREYLRAQESYERAKVNAFQIDEDEIKKVYCLKRFVEKDGEHLC